MELQLEKRKIGLNEVVYSGSSEQSIELDYILPDYYSDIFKIIKCMVCPTVTSVNSNNDRINFDVDVNIKVLYISSEDSTVKCIEQKYNYTKNIELNTTDEVNVSILPKVDYVNCRAVNERRLSIRATVNSIINAVAVSQKEIPVNGEGSGIQLRKKTLSCLGELININKKFNYSEEISFSESKDDISGIYNIEAKLMNCDYKIIANKIIVKAKCQAEITYCVGNEIKVRSEQIQLSNIIDAVGITDEHECKILLKICNCDYELMGTDTAVLLLNINAEAICKGYICDETEIIDDAYSTEYECEIKKDTVETEHYCKDIDDNIEVLTNIKLDDISNVETVIVTLHDISDILKESLITGTVNVLVIGKNNNGEIIFSEKSTVFEYDCKTDCKKLSGILSISKKSDSYTLFADGTIEIKAELSIKASAFTTEQNDVITNIEVKETKNNSTSNHGIKIYYAQSGESVWEIAKRFNSKADAIINENEITNEILENKCALLIPMVF